MHVHVHTHTSVLLIIMNNSDPWRDPVKWFTETSAWFVDSVTST